MGFNPCPHVLAAPCGDAASEVDRRGEFFQLDPAPYGRRVDADEVDEIGHADESGGGQCRRLQFGVCSLRLDVCDGCQVFLH